MNVLPFVMAVLMLLTTLTYQRLQSFRSCKGIAFGLNDFLREGERESFNRMMKHKYDDMKVKDGGGGGGVKVKAAARLNLGVLLNPQKDPQRYEAYAQLTKELVQTIYGNQPFFKELEANRPAYMDELLEALAHLDQKVSGQSSLFNVKLQDPTLNELLYRLLKKQKVGLSLSDVARKQDYDDIRLYLAHSQLLQAIYHDPYIVEEIVKERNEIYKALRRKDGSVEKASKCFDAVIKRFATPLQPYLNTEVSTTDPKNYIKEDT